MADKVEIYKIENKLSELEIRKIAAKEMEAHGVPIPDDYFVV